MWADDGEEEQGTFTQSLLDTWVAYADEVNDRIEAAYASKKKEQKLDGQRYVHPY